MPYALSKSDIAYKDSLQLLADYHYSIKENISRASWLTIWDISSEIADVEENYDSDPEWGDRRIPQLKALNAKDNSLQDFVDIELDDFQSDHDSMEGYFEIGESGSCSYSNIEEFCDDIEWDKVSEINQEALKLSMSESTMFQLREILQQGKNQ